MYAQESEQKDGGAGDDDDQLQPLVHEHRPRPAGAIVAIGATIMNVMGSVFKFRWK